MNERKCVICQEREERWHRWRDRALDELEDAAWFALGYFIGEVFLVPMIGQVRRGNKRTVICPPSGPSVS